VSIDDLEQQLSDFDSAVRRAALAELAGRTAHGEIRFPPPQPKVNIHFHSFFSFNSKGWSPSRIAWEASKRGLEVAGIVDFDVLDGLEEFIDAGELLGLKATVGLETRVCVPEYADMVLTSPNEPGIHYFMIQGAYKRPEPGSEAEAALKMMARVARERNIGVMQRMNGHLGDVTLDYERDVLPLTPSGNATERHLLFAYDRKAREVFGGGAAAFWARILGLPEPEARSLMSNTPAFHEKIRSKLVKFGGVAYVPPDSGSFPRVEQVVAMARGVGALPTTTWLDGTNDGEHDMMANLELFVSKGAAAMNVIPDRSWNVRDPVEKALKLGKLREAVEAARAFDLPLSVGTEMNRHGLPVVDDFAAPELASCVEDFVRGARFFYGHTLLARWADLGYFSEAAEAAFGTDRRAKNGFFAEVGAAARPSARMYNLLRERKGELTPAEALDMVRRV